jgi:NADH-quinone oxidoreductase subunit M
MLVWLMVILFAGGIFAWVSESFTPTSGRRIALLSLSIALVMLLPWLFSDAREFSLGGTEGWLLYSKTPWIPRFGISFTLAMDGLSLLLIGLTLFLGLIAVAASWIEIQERVGFYYFNLLWSLAGVIGVFAAMDLFLFFFFWEVMLIPMYFLIGIWGHENRSYAAMKFFIYTQSSSLLMLVSIIALALLHQQENGQLSFSYFDLLGSGSRSPYGVWLMLGFFIAFAVKLPAFPLHTWLPDAHTQAPTAGSIILAGVLLKTGAYGLIRFLIPLFPDSLGYFAPYAMTIGVIGIIYAALMAFSQQDLKRLIAYTSISHMGFILLGVYAWNQLALQGVVMQMLTHGLSAAALFMLAGAIQHRIHTRDLREMGGLWKQVPRIGCVALFFAMASLGLPGLGNFVGEFLILIGTFQVNWPLTVIATLGLITAAIYSLIIIQKAFHGPVRLDKMPDFGWREMSAMGAMMIGLIWMGLFPQPILDTATVALAQLESLATSPITTLAGR